MQSKRVVQPSILIPVVTAIMRGNNTSPFQHADHPIHQFWNDAMMIAESNPDLKIQAGSNMNAAAKNNTWHRARRESRRASKEAEENNDAGGHYSWGSRAERTRSDLYRWVYTDFIVEIQACPRTNSPTRRPKQISSHI